MYIRYNEISKTKKKTKKETEKTQIADIRIVQAHEKDKVTARI